MITNSIIPNSLFMVIAPEPARPAAQSPTAKRMLDTKEPLPLDQELKVALGLLLKHRGGPGFGHGRLEGDELEALGTRLRGVAAKLTDEANKFVQQ